MKNNKSRVILTALAMILACVPTLASTGRAISLNALAASMKSGGSDDAEHLCGVTKVLGYLIDSKSKDVVLIGKVDPRLPPLYLDDLAVALRSAWMSYIKVKNGIRYYAPPGCSIDPNPKVLQQLQNLEQPDLSDKDSAQRYTDEWKRVAAQPQAVRVIGVPFDTRFAKVMVDADFYMKRIVNGSVMLGIDGLHSLTDLRVNQFVKDMESETEPRDPAMTLNRFWFNPGETTYEVRDGISLLRSCPVRLLTEEEFLTEQGAVAGKGRPDPMAGEFSKNFTLKYEAIASVRPIYHELEGLFRFAALAKIMKDDRAEAMLTSGVNYLLKAHELKCVPVSRAVKGLTDVRSIEDSIDSPDGSKRTFRAIQTTCGGVSMDVRPKRIRTARAPKIEHARITEASARTEPSAKANSTASGSARKSSGKLTTTVRQAPRPNLKHVVLSTRKSPKVVAWDFPIDED